MDAFLDDLELIEEHGFNSYNLSTNRDESFKGSLYMIAADYPGVCSTAGIDKKESNIKHHLIF